MTEEILNIIRCKLNEEVNKRNSLINEFRRLENDSSVKKYLKMRDIDVIDENEYSIDESQIIMDLYTECVNNNIETNEIYYYCDVNIPVIKKNDGYYLCSSGKDFVKLYKNIENSADELYILEPECDSFEDSHIILSGNKYEDIHKEFIIDMVKNSQDVAIKRIVKKYHKK